MGVCHGQTKQRQSFHPPSEIKRFARQNIRNFYRFGRVLGSGSFGTVKIGFSLRDAKSYAIKTINKYKMREQFYLVQRELDILTQLDHPNIIKVFEEYEDEQYYHFVMEFSSGGELLERILHKGYIEEGEARVIMKQLFSAINYIHQVGIVHRDLKPENILFANPNADSPIKIIDFGLSKKFRGYSQKLKRMKSKVGTPIYVAPEVLTGDYSYQCDEWSLGCIMHVLLCGEPPFYSKVINMLEAKIRHQKVDFFQPQFGDVSKEAKQLIVRLLDKSPKKRITCEEALEHDWFKLQLNSVPQSQSKLSNKDHEKIYKMLNTYANTTKLKKETLKILLNQLNEKQITQLKEVFEHYDTDGNGMVSVEELQKIIGKLGFTETEKEITDLIGKITLRKQTIECNIQYSDFLSALINCKTFLNRERLWSLFRYFDQDNKQYITMADIKNAFAREGREFSQNKLLDYYSEVAKGKEAIDFEEFCQIMQQDFEDKILKDTETQMEKQISEKRSKEPISREIDHQVQQVTQKPPALEPTPQQLPQTKIQSSIKLNSQD